jgi:hypothetical protein
MYVLAVVTRSSWPDVDEAEGVVDPDGFPSEADDAGHVGAGEYDEPWL